MRKIEEHEGKKYLMTDNYMPDRILGKIKNIIRIEIFDDAKILIDIGDKLSNNIALKNVVT